MPASFENLFSIKGKVALVTGGSRGIGEMIAAGFMASGAKVYISSRKADVCEATAKRLSETYGGTCVSLPADLSQMSGVASLASRLAALEPKLDILVNNAGADWDRVGRGNPSGRVGDARDIAGLAIFLSSRAGQYVVGQTIACDGGSVASS